MDSINIVEKKENSKKSSCYFFPQEIQLKGNLRLVVSSNHYLQQKFLYK
ncbi:hypothetical protein [Citrobacter werkmanii]|nr:hypothetical protein [Citrobacter werkmanii]